MVYYDYIRTVVLCVAILSIPVLICSAFLTWRMRYRSDLPAWRTRLGLASMAIISFYWIVFVLFATAAQFLEFGHSTIQILEVWFDTHFLAMLLAAALAVALKREPRTLTIGASVLVIVMFFASYTCILI